MKKIKIFFLITVLLSCNSIKYEKIEIPVELIGGEIKVFLGDDINGYKNNFVYDDSVRDYYYTFKKNLLFDYIYLNTLNGKINEVTLAKDIKLIENNDEIISKIITICDHYYKNKHELSETTQLLTSTIRYKTFIWTLLENKITIKLNFIPYDRVVNNLSFFKKSKINKTYIELTFSQLQTK